ncbi:hypothetical protein [Fodinicurvata fenggangensis]|uniref:hypothetical protein n=1 Tax=Fodinicurvata fenggangensis TaxID=1121830 RepID=UPI00047983E9|nr:hypothetical protein [Fodinicurvata fenggangensis]
MSAATIALLQQAGDPDSPVAEVGGRLAIWLRDWPAKVLARTIGVSVRTAESWKAGQVPQFRHLLAMVDLWGEGFLDYLFAPVLEAQESSVAHQITRIRASLTRLEEELAADAAAQNPTTDSPAPAAAASAAGVASHSEGLAPHGPGAAAPLDGDTAAPGAARSLALKAGAVKAGLGIVLTLALLLPQDLDARTSVRRDRLGRPGAARVLRGREIEPCGS